MYKKVIIKTVISMSLSFLLLLPLMAPGLAAYAEEELDAPPEVELEDPPPDVELEDPPESVTEPAAPDPPEEIEPRAPDLPEDEIEGALVSIEDEYTVTYKELDGSYTTHFSSSRRAYRERRGGRLKEIDNTWKGMPPPWPPPTMKTRTPTILCKYRRSSQALAGSVLNVTAKR